MGASTDDMINQLQASIATPPQPSLFGVQAPPDVAGLRALLAKLQQQKYLSTVGQTGGQYGYLHDAGQSALANVGQQLGSAAGGALAQPPPGAAPAAPSAQQQMSMAVQQAQKAYQSQIAAGVDENTARTNATKMLIAAGVPGAADVLQKTQSTGLENDFKKAETAKDVSQGNMDDASIAQKKREADQNTWTTIKETPEYTIQKNALGEVRSVKVSDRASLPDTPEQIANKTILGKKVGDYDLDIASVVGRGSPKERQDFLANYVYPHNQDYDIKNFKQSQDSLKAYGPSGVQGQLVLKTQNAMNHLTALDQWGRALKNGDMKAAQTAENFFKGEFNDPSLSTYDTVAPIVANEVSGAIVKGGGGVQERLARVKDFSDLKNDAARSGAINGVRSLLGAQYKNNQNLYEKTTLRKDFGDRFPIEGGFPPPPGTGGGASSGWGPAKVVGK